MNTIVQPGAACLLPPGMREARDRPVEQPFRATSITGPRYRDLIPGGAFRAARLAGAGCATRPEPRRSGR
jgi:hypothetical protein